MGQTVNELMVRRRKMMFFVVYMSQRSQKPEMPGGTKLEQRYALIPAPWAVMLSLDTSNKLPSGRCMPEVNDQ